MRKIPINGQDRARWSDSLNGTAIIRQLGLKVDLSDESIVRVHLSEMRECHRDGIAGCTMNGMVVTGMLECAIGVVGVLHFCEQKAGVIDLNVKIVRPVYGKAAVAEAFVERKGRHLCFCQGSLLDDRGRLCAMATGIVAHA